MGTSLAQLLLAALAGGLLGAFYFAVLWITVQRMAVVRRPALWVLLSLVLRMVVLLVGLYWATDAQWARLLVALAAVIAVRTVLTRRLSPREAVNSKIGYGKLR